MKKGIYKWIYFYLEYRLFLIDIFAQKKKNKNENKEINSYIKKFKNAIVIDLFTDNYHYDSSIERDGEVISIKPNTPLSTNIAVCYKLLRLQYGITNLFNQVNTYENGKTTDTNIKFSFFIKRFRQIVFYHSIQGMYLENTADIVDGYQVGDPKKQYPDMSQYIFEGQSSYNFNPNFSHRALDLENEWQKRSTLSFSPYFIYNYRRVRNIPSKKNGHNYLPLQLLKSIDNFDFDFQPRLYSILVYKENWFLMTMLYPSIGYRYSVNGGDDDNSKISEHVLFWGGGSCIQIGNNSPKFYAGSIYTLRLTQFNANNSYFTDSRGYFSIYLGFRFTMPNFLKMNNNNSEIMIDVQHSKD